MSDDENAAAEAASHVVRIANARDGEGFIATTPEQRKRFWLDRARTAAISRHTNAFKINEDVVIPLERLGDYTDGIERINIEFSIANKLKLLRRAWRSSSRGRAAGRRRAMRGRAQSARRRWRSSAPPARPLEGSVQSTAWTIPAVFEDVQLHRKRISWKKELRDPLRDIFSGRDFEPVMKAIEAIHAEVLRGRVFVALHMHAGDGNVHTNIPVNSDDYEMLRAGERGRRAHHEVRALAGRRDLGRARHRHHQARVPRAARRSQAFVGLQEARGSRRATSTAASSSPGADLRLAYTPSFALIGHESLILEQNDIGAIADMFKDCLRCGKCKPVCSTHVPRANLLYSPRNKILATSLLTEAFLYEEQTRRGVSIRHFDEYGDVADHCTVCHKCESPCPVDIDFGDVSIAMRNLLAKLRKRRFNPGTWARAAVPERAGPGTDQAHQGGDDRLRLPRAAPRQQALGAHALRAEARCASRRETVGRAPHRARR